MRLDDRDHASWSPSLQPPGAAPQFRVSVPDIGPAERLNAWRCMQSAMVGPAGFYRDQFEARFAALIGARHVLSTSNGTTALHLALMLNDVRPGDEVIVPSMTYVATANAIRHTGATPVFADISAETWCLDPGDVAARITPRTRGIVAVHLFGNIAASAALDAVAAAHGLWVIYDAAHASLSTQGSAGSGSLGRLSAYSFHLNKTITCGEGGALALNDDALLERARWLRSHGMDYHQRNLLHEVGYNYRLSNLHCSILCAQLDNIDTIRARRAAIAAAYGEALSGTPGLSFQPLQPGSQTEVWLYSLLCDRGAGAPPRDAVIAGLAAEGVEARAFFPAIHRMAFHVPPPGRSIPDLPVTDRLAQDGFSLPTYNAMTPDDARVIAERLKRVLDRQASGPVNRLMGVS